MSRHISPTTYKYLYSKSAGRCNICQTFLFTQNEKNIGDMAHIIAHSPDGNAPRSDLDGSGNNSYDNLILLCPTHHREVDREPLRYPVDYLKKIKNDFEEFIKKRLSTDNKDMLLLENINTASKLLNFSFQNTLYQLRNYNTPKVIPASILGIRDIEDYVLEPFSPSLYPFNDINLNTHMMAMLNSYYSLHPYLMSYYNDNNIFDYNSGTFTPFSRNYQSRISPENLEIVNSILSELAKAIHDWVSYLSNNYNMY